MKTELTKEEIELLDKLGEAFNDFCKLPTLHPFCKPEFMTAIHAAQNIVLSRSGLRQLQKENNK